MKYFWSSLIISITCLSVGYMSSLLQTDSLIYWYPYLVKSPITPPDYIFPTVWSILYILMGVSLGITWYLPPKIFNRMLGPFILQLMLNVAWSILFFKLRSPGMGLVCILILLTVSVIYMLRCLKYRRLAAYIFTPYVLWLLFATYLNGYIFFAN